jgi:hypothetical protein
VSVMCWKHTSFIADTTMCKVYYAVTSLSEVLLEKLIFTVRVKKFPIFYETWKFITMFKVAHQWILSWTS